jgi:hypothetical protein
MKTFYNLLMAFIGIVGIFETNFSRPNVISYLETLDLTFTQHIVLFTLFVTQNDKFIYFSAMRAIYQNIINLGKLQSNL